MEAQDTSEVTFPFTNLLPDLQHHCLDYLPDKKTGRLVSKAWQQYIDQHLVKQGGLTVTLSGNEVTQLTGEFKPLIRHLGLPVKEFRRKEWTHADIRELSLSSVDFNTYPLPTLVAKCTRLDKLDIRYHCTGLTGSQLWHAQPFLPQLTELVLWEGSQEVMSAACLAFPGLSTLRAPQEVDPLLIASNCSRLKDLDSWTDDKNIAWTAGAIQALSERAVCLQSFYPGNMDPNALEALEQLRRLPQLKTLRLPEIKSGYTYDLEKALRHLNQLTKLEVEGECHFKHLSAVVRHCGNLKCFSLGGPITQKEIALLAQHEWVSLEELYIYPMEEKASSDLLDLTPWTHPMPKLRALTIDFQYRPVRLGSLPHLEELWAELRTLQFDWSTAHQLHNVGPYDDPLDAELVAKVLALPKLTTFFPNKITPSLSAAFAKAGTLNCLKELTVYAITNLEFSAIATHCPKLEKLWANNSPEVTGESLTSHSTPRASLQELSLNPSKISEQGMAAICRVYPNIKSWSLDETTITDHSLGQLKWTELTYLHFSSSQVTEKGIKALIPEDHQLTGLRWKEAPSDFKSYLFWTLGIAC